MVWGISHFSMACHRGFLDAALSFRTTRLGYQSQEHWAQWPFQPCLKSCSNQLSEGQLYPGEHPHVLQKPVAKKEGLIQSISPIFPPSLGKGLSRYPSSCLRPHSFWHFCCFPCNSVEVGSHQYDGNNSRQEQMLCARYSLPR